MEVYKSVPTDSEVFTHEAEMVKLFNTLSWVFIAVSAIFITSSWNIYLDETLDKIGWLRWPAVIILGAAVCLPIEILIFRLSKYFWRSIIKKYTSGAHLGQFVTATVLLILLLAYSFYMSQKGTKIAMDNGGKSFKLVDTKEVDATYNASIRANAMKYADEANAIDSRIDGESKTVSGKYEAVLDSLTKEYEYYSALVAKGRKYGPKLTTISRQMSNAESEKQRQLAALASEKNSALDNAQQAKTKSDALAAKIREENTAILTTGTGTDNTNIALFKKIFSRFISTVAGMLTFFIFVMARFIESFYVRSGMKHTVFLDNWDLRTGSAILDFLKYPFIAATRRLSEKTARWYAALPAPPPPPNPQAIYNPATMTQPILAVTGGSQGAPYKPGSSAPAGPPPTATIPASFSASSQPSPSPGHGSSGSDPFSLKDSKNSAGGDSTGPKAPADIVDLINAEFKNSPNDPAFYDMIRLNPANFMIAFEYIYRLKKNARNCLSAQLKITGKQETRDRNKERLDGMLRELARLYVGAEFVENGGSLTYHWLTKEERDSAVAQYGNP